MYLSVITDKTLDEASAMLSNKFSTIQATGNVSLTNDPNPHTGIYAEQVIRYTTSPAIKSVESQRERILNIEYWFPDK